MFQHKGWVFPLTRALNKTDSSLRTLTSKISLEYYVMAKRNSNGQLQFHVSHARSLVFVDKFECLSQSQNNVASSVDGVFHESPNRHIHTH